MKKRACHNQLFMKQKYHFPFMYMLSDQLQYILWCLAFLHIHTDNFSFLHTITFIMEDSHYRSADSLQAGGSAVVYKWSILWPDDSQYKYQCGTEADTALFGASTQSPYLAHYQLELIKIIETLDAVKYCVGNPNRIGKQHYLEFPVTKSNIKKNP